VVQTMVLITAFIIVFVNLIVDLIYAWLDPRISYR
jgi:peptide/nickel transport system permease protein